jgi:small conductance mechanosensitive channel
MDKEIETLQNVVNIASEFIIEYGFQIIGAIIILIIGWQLAKWVAKLVLRLCERGNVDVTLAKFIANIAKAVVLVFVVIIALGKFGITIAPFIAALGAVAFGSTLALQGPLSNYGSGFTIILTRPFVVGDTIRVQGVTGIVEEIKLAHTELSTEDSERITIPNNDIMGEILTNSYSNLIVEKKIAISYDDDPDQAVSIILKVLTQTQDVVDNPAPQVGIEGFGDSAIEIGVRYWVPTRRYYQVMYAANREIYKALKTGNIHIPYPRQVIQLHNQD